MNELCGDQIGQAQEYAGDYHETQDHTGGLHNLSAVGPMYPLQLEPASPDESGEPRGGRLAALRGGQANRWLSGLSLRIY